jgi:hypothetical protein
MGGFPFNNLPGTELFVLPVAVIIYFVLLWDARRPNSPAAQDDQIGLKTIGAALTLVGVLMAAGGLQSVVHVLLTFTDFLDRLKAALPDLVVGGFVTILAAFVLVPKTNAAQFPKSKRLTAGAIALGAGTTSVSALADVLRRVINWSSWSPVADAVSLLAVTGVLFAAGMIALGKLSGVEMAPQSASPPLHPGQAAQAQGHMAQQAHAQQQAQQQQHAQQQHQHAQQQQQHAQQQGYPGYDQGQQNPGYPPHGQQ